MRHELVQSLIKKPKSWADAVREPGLPMPPGVGGRFTSLSDVPGLRSVRFNWLGRSIVVEYDPAFWQPAWWDEIMGTQDEKRLRALLETMMEKLELLSEKN
jgi:hypothetical protein